MCPQWIPQNIQKRLLLYVLQQLSLFSEIDLPNLEEVSLNNILLRDVLIDPEKVGKLPGCNLRYGKVGQLELNGGVMGGVNIEVSDVELVVAPSFDGAAMANSAGRGGANSVHFLIAQSTADLANTIMVDKDEDMLETSDKGKDLLQSDDDGEEDDDDDDEDGDGDDDKTVKSSSSRTSSSSGKPSALSGVMAKAVEIALLRLQITITNLLIKIVSELTDLRIEVDSVSVKTINGNRKIKMSGIKIITLSDVNPGERQPSPSSSATATPSASKADSVPTSDDEDDGYGDESLMDSMVFTHEEASSIYMSATSQSFQRDEAEASDGVVVIYIDEVSTSFEGLSKINDLEVIVGELKIAAVPAFPTVVSIFTSITKNLKLRHYQLKKENFTIRKHSRFPQYEADDEPPSAASSAQQQTPSATSDVEDDDLPFFKKLNVKGIEVSLTSALLPTGEFSSNDNTVILIKNLHIRQKNEDLIYGGIEVFEIVQTKASVESKIMGYELASTVDVSLKASTPDPAASAIISKADVRFEWFINESKETEFTILCSKPLTINLSKDSLPILINFGISISTTLTNFQYLKTSLKAYQQPEQPRTRQLKSYSTTWVPSTATETGETSTGGAIHVIFQSALISINLKLNKLTIKSVILPISYKLIQNQLNIQKLLVYSVDDQLNDEVLLTSIANIKLFTKAKEFKSYVVRSSGSHVNAATAENSTSSSNYPRVVSLTSSLILAIPEIKISSSMKHLKRLVTEVKDISSYFSSNLEVNSIENSFKLPTQKKSEHPSYSLQASMYSSRRMGRRAPPLSNSSSLPTNSAMLTNHISFRISINAIEIKITDIFPKFGHFNMSFEKFTVDVLRNGNIQGSLLSANMYREFNGNIDKFIYEFTGDDKRQSKYPLVVFSYKKFDKTNTLDVYAWNFMVEYYTIWLQLIENEVHEQPPVEAVLEVLPESTPSSNVSVLRKLDVKFNLHDCSIGLSPGRLNCKGFVCIERGTADLTIGENQLYIKSSFRDISVLLIDDIKNITTAGRVTDSLPHGYRSPVAWFSSVGCLNIGYINVTHVGVTVTSNVEAIKARNERLKIKDKLSVLELKINLDEHTINVCADSTHTLVQLINDLKEPIVFLDEEKFKVQLLDKVDLLEEIGNIFGESTNSSRSDDNTPKLRESMGSLNILDEYIPESGGDSFEQDMANLNISNSVLNDSNLTSIDEEHFTMEDRHNHGNRVAIPVLMFINASKIHIRLFDGYDWDETRQVIKGAVKRVETQAVEEMSSSSPFKANSKARVQFEDDMDDSDVAPPLIGETLYQSIHLSIPAGVNPSLLTRNINKNVQSEEKEDPLDVNYKNLKLKRSQFHKLAIEVSNLEVIVSVFTTRDPRDTSIDVSGLPESEIVNQVDLKVENFEILDKVPTSTWHKFVGYLRTAGERELLTKSFKLSLQNVRPNSNLCATEAIIDVSILPLRLYVDQDTLDFITRFGEFKDSRFELPIDDILYIQKFKISSLKIKLDYKPKKIDYAGIGSGHTAEFINFFILDGAEILLKKVTLYGLLGFPKLALELKNVWAPDVQSTQLIGVLAGLAPIRSIVNIGTGVKDLVAIPISEYKKDGRLMRSLQKGAFLFAKTTSAELLKLGVKLAAGTQVLLEQGEEAFGGEGSSARLPSGVSKKVKTQKGLGRKETYVEVDVDDEEDDEDYDDFDNESYIRSNSPLVYAIAERKSIENDLMASSQLLNQSLQMENNHQNRHNYGSSRKLYSFAEIDDSTIDSKLLRKTFATKAPKPNNTNNNNTSAAVNDSLVKDDETQKAVSLYSNQPIGAQEGLQLAYNSIGRNFKSTKVAVIRTRDAMIDAGSVPEAAVAMAKGAPVILIRPIIGATEVVQKTLLGLTNQIDPNQKLESEEKYKPM